jgi:8-oxo-dGTP pyrophosphatase MutT (NUDIX family)
MSKPYRQAVLAIIIREDGKFLFGSSPRDEGYKFPQGGIDPGETAEECLTRELKEELGVEISKSDVIGQLKETVAYPYPDYKPYSKLYCGQQMHIFVVRHQLYFNWQPQDDEFDELVWIFPHEITNYDCVYRKEAYIEAMKLLEQFNR